MKEITDEHLAELRASLSVCNPLVQSLVMRLERVEGERDKAQAQNDFDCSTHQCDRLYEIVIPLRAEVSALRLRVETAERDVRLLRQQLTGEKEAYALSDKIATERMHKAEKAAAEAYFLGQADMRKSAADAVMVGCPTSEVEAVKRYGANWRYNAVLALPIKDSP